MARSLLIAFGDIGDGAAAIAYIVASRSSRLLHIQDLNGIPSSVIERVTLDFCERGWLSRVSGGWTVALRGTWQAMPEDVPAFLQGAAAMRIVLEAERQAFAAVTMPRPPSALANALPGTGMAHAALVPTADAMGRVADQAIDRLTVMTPFLNQEGLRFALSLFERSRADRRCLIVRPSQGTRDILTAARSRIRESRVDVRGYVLPALSGTGYETFHAKIVLADSGAAYVGSANMLSYARASAELGIVVRGSEARVVASVVRAVESISLRVDLG